MGNQITKRLAALLSVKSIITMCMVAVFTVLSLRGTISENDFNTIFLMVISFYFGTQSERKGANESGNNEKNH